MQLPNLLLNPHPLHPLPSSRPSHPSHPSPSTSPDSTCPPSSPTTSLPTHPIISPHCRPFPPRGLLLADHRLPRHAVEDVGALRGKPF